MSFIIINNTITTINNLPVMNLTVSTTDEFSFSSIEDMIIPFKREFLNHCPDATGISHTVVGDTVFFHSHVLHFYITAKLTYHDVSTFICKYVIYTEEDMEVVYDILKE